MDKNKFNSVKVDNLKVKIAKTTEEQVDNFKKDSKKKKQRIIKASILMFVLTLLLIGFGFLWQWKISLLAFCNALWLALTIEFFIGWVMFVYNRNVLSSLIHGTKTFFLFFVGKKPKHNYYDYMKNIQDNPIPNFYYRVIFISTLILLVPAVVLVIILV